MHTETFTMRRSKHEN